MSITLTQVITTEEYLSIYPQDSAVETDLIQSAINRAIITLDGICGGVIAQVWPISDPESQYYDPTSALFRTTTEIGFIKQAHLLQAQWNVSRNLDMTAGTESYTSGSNNYNETRPRADLVADEVIYQLLAQGRVYNPNIATETTIHSGTIGDDFYNPTSDPLDQYVTYNVGDNRYVPKHWSDAYGKFLYYDGNGNATGATITASETGTSTIPAYYLTIGDTTYKLGGNSHTRYIELYGMSGTLTDEQLSVLSENSGNYIWWANTDPSDDGVFLWPTYWEPNVKSTYEKVLGDTNYKLEINIVAKTWTMTTKYFTVLPTTVNDRYLHTNATTGALEWSELDLSSKIDLLGNEAVSGEPYHFGYYYLITPNANNIDVLEKTITLDNNKTITDYHLTVPAATTTNAGLLSAADQTISGVKTFSNAPVMSSITKSSGGTTYNLTLPDKTGTIALTSDLTSYQPLITSTNKLSYSLLSDTPTIPTKTSDLTNDSGFITSSSLSGYVDTTSAQNVGGIKTFTSSIKVNTGLGSILASNNNDVVTVSGGTSYSDAGVLMLYGAGHSETPYQFALKSTKDNLAATTSTLSGYYDGTLTWKVGTNTYNVLTDGQTQTISGAKTFTSDLTISGKSIIIKTGDNAIKTNSDTSYYTIVGGTNYSKSPRIQLNGKSRSTKAGQVELIASDGTDETYLKLNPDGTATWGGHSLVGVKSTPTAGTGITISNTTCTYVRTGNMVYVWGIVTIASGTYSSGTTFLSGLPKNISEGYGTGIISIGNNSYRLRIDLDGTTITWLDSCTLTSNAYGSFTFMYLAQ